MSPSSPLTDYFAEACNWSMLYPSERATVRAFLNCVGSGTWVASQAEGIVTVCIAAATSSEYIVTASDTRVGGAMGSTDNMLAKSEMFHEHWTAMYAAEDISQVPPIIQRARQQFIGKENTAENAVASFKEAFQEYCSEAAADRFLGRFNMSMDSFVKQGVASFTESKFNELCGKISESMVGCKFLLYGFDDNKKAHVVAVEEPGVEQWHDLEGYDAVGSGQYLANSILLYLGQNRDTPMAQTIYNVHAAKFMAEKEGNVGENTYFLILRYGTAGVSYPVGLGEMLRDEWNERGCPRMPNGIIQKIQNWGISILGRGKGEDREAYPLFHAPSGPETPGQGE